MLEFPITSPGELGEAREFAAFSSFPNHWTDGEAEPDGMALDTDGNLYVAHYGAGTVQVFDTEGRLLGSCTSGASAVTNLAFGGDELSELYIYAATGEATDDIAWGRIVRLALPGVMGLDLTSGDTAMESQ